MLYKYDKNRATFKVLRSKTYVKLIALFVTIYGLSTFASYKYGIKAGLSHLSTEEKVTLIKQNDAFNEDKMIEMMKDLNIKFPWIPMAQSIVETGHWKSNIFFENNNLFGMKEAKTRITTSLGTQNNHSYYNTWRESVYDYAFYQSRYLGTITTEEDYYAYIQATYSETPDYSKQIRDAVRIFNLKQKFK